jgi:Uma2 family endonuclease
LSGLKIWEEIIGCSSYQSVLIGYLNAQLWNHLEDAPYWVMSNEIGNHLSEESKTVYDIAVFDEANLPAHRIGAHYINVPPKLVIEVDVKIETESKTPGDIAWQIKTNKLHEFGVEKVVWFFTTSQRVLIARLNEDWIFTDWHRNIELWEGLKVNVGQYLAKRRIQSIDQPNES